MNCRQFIAKSLAVRTASHLLHLSATSYAQHVALGEFYDTMLGLVDRYAEVYMGKGGRIDNFPAIMPPRSGAVELLSDYLGLIHEEQTGDATDQALANILAELEAVTSQTIYKIKVLK